MTPEERIVEARRQSLRAVELARWLSLASRISPALLRRFRLRFLRRSGPGVEAELWFSPLVDVRSGRGILFHPEPAALLRQELGQSEREPARGLLVETQATRPPLVRLEEDLIWLGLAYRRTGDEEALNRALRPMIKAVVDQDRKGLGRWALASLRRIPELQGVPSAVLLQISSESRLFDGAVTLDPRMGSKLAAGERGLLLTGRKRIKIGVFMADGRLGVREPPQERDPTVEVPDTQSRYLTTALSSTHWQWSTSWAQKRRGC